MSKKKKERFNIKEFLTNNKAIFNYIYDKNDLKQGIVIAFPSELKGRCKIGWALFTEVSNEEKEIFTGEQLVDLAMKELNNWVDKLPKFDNPYEIMRMEVI